mgnify:CR=1 FL=1
MNPTNETVVFFFNDYVIRLCEAFGLHNERL